MTDYIVQLNCTERHFVFRTRGERPEMVTLFRAKGFPLADGSTDREDSGYNYIDKYSWFRFSTTSDDKVNEVSIWIFATDGVRTSRTPDGLPHHIISPSFFDEAL